MAQRQDTDVIRLSLVYNELVERAAVSRLPDDLQGDAIPDQVHEHEQQQREKRSARTGEGSARETTAQTYEQTARYLTRVRHAVLSAYNDPEDTRLASYGALGLGATPEENQQRLAELAEVLRAPLASGEIALVADLRPDVLAAHATKHLNAPKEKADATKNRQVKGTSLSTARRTSRVMVQRLKNFVKSFYGANELTAFGFDVPLPSTRPKLKGVPGDQPAGEEKKEKEGV